MSATDVYPQLILYLRTCGEILSMSRNLPQNMRESNMQLQLEKNPKNRNRLMLCLILVSAMLKAGYALSRDIFESGPDANGYIPFAVGFAEEDFFSPKIMGPPYYPSGYPYILSLIVRIAPGHWFELSQLFQIAMFSLASYLFYHLIDHMFSWKIAGIATLILCFNPAWAVVNGEAMYETLLVSFLIFSIYFLINPLKQSENYTKGSLITSGVFAGIATVIHPRVFPLFLIIYFVFFLTRIKSITKAMVLFGSITIFPLLFAMRNLQAKGSFTLMNSFWDGQAFNAFLTGCRSYACAAEKIIASPIGFLEQSYMSGIGFWSPHSGPLMKGTWYHNISLISFLNAHGYNKLSIYISLVFSILIFFTWIFGSILLYKKNRFYGILLFLLAGIIWLTDILVYGENRHRLVALIFMLPAHSICILKLVKQFRLKAINPNPF